MNGTMEDGESWCDITDEIKLCSGELEVGELLHDTNFTLYDAMSAFEMMDPKMDSGMVSMLSMKNPSKTLKSCIDSGILKLDGFSNEELCHLFDGSFCALISWIEGGSMAQTIFANLYLHNPFLIEHRVMKSFCISFLKLVDRIKDMVTQTSVYEEEHFQSVTYGFQLADSVTIQRASGMLKEGEDDLNKQLRSLKSRQQESDSSCLIEYSQVLQVVHRFRVLRHLYLLVLAIKYEAVNPADDAGKCVDRLKESLDAIQSSDLSSHGFSKLENPFELPAFDVSATSRLLPPSFPRAVQLSAYDETIRQLIKLCNQVRKILSIPKSIGLIETMAYFDDITLDTPSVLVRSMLLYHYLPPGTGRVYNKVKLTDIIVEELKNFNSPPPVSASFKALLMGVDDAKLVFNAYLASCAHVMEGLLTTRCNTRTRQRERIAYLLEEFGILQSEAERADSVIDTVLRDRIGDKAVVKISSGLGTWTLNITTRCMIMYLNLGMELQLYDSREYCYVFWYMAEVLFLWNTSSLFRAENCIAELAHHESKAASGKKKNKSKKSAVPKSLTQTHQFELLLARSKQHLSGGLYKLMIALKLSHLLPTTGDYQYDNEQVRFGHRFSPFLSVHFPQVVPYDSYIKAIDACKQESDTSTTIHDNMEQACRSFQNAKTLLESEQVKPAVQVSNLLSIAKNNLVVSRLLAVNLQKENKIHRSVGFDFSVDSVFPMIKLVM